MSKSKKPPVDWAQRVADEVARYIEQNDTLPWLKPWHINGVFPRNLQTGHTYTGINTLLLGMFGVARGYESPYYVTINGMEKLGGRFRDWEGDAKPNGLPIVFWKFIDIDDKDNPGHKKKIPLLKGWTVWNVAHIDGLVVPKVEPAFVDVPDAISGMESLYPNPPKITHVPSDKAYYSPLMDEIVLPRQDQFTSLIGYAETKAHELVHSTGHKSRLARFDNDANPHEAYAREELVAEIGAAIVLQRLGMNPDMRRMADYVRGWGTVIKNDPKMLVSAANRADKAAGLILGDGIQESESEVAA